jgi:hypothetical protein
MSLYAREITSLTLVHIMSSQAHCTSQHTGRSAVTGFEEHLHAPHVQQSFWRRFLLYHRHDPLFVCKGRENLRLLFTMV